MKRFFVPVVALTVALIALATSRSLTAQQARISPAEIASLVTDGSRVMIVYSRPYTKDPKSGAKRKIWGELVPFGKVWRAGANEATLLITQKDIVLGGKAVPAGVYSLYALPAEKGTSKLIINKKFGQGGDEYDEKQDFARVDLKKETVAAPVDQFTIAVEKMGDGGVLKLTWETTQFSVPFSVKK